MYASRRCCITTTCAENLPREREGRKIRVLLLMMLLWHISNFSHLLLIPFIHTFFAIINIPVLFFEGVDIH